MKTYALLTLAAFGLAANLSAQIITHTPADAVSNGVAISSPFSSLAAGGTVGTSLIAFGVDYSWGNTEGVFTDPPLAFAGVNGSGQLDLLTGVDGRIVQLNTLNQGLTDHVSVLAGNSAAGSLLLSVFDASGQLITSVTNPVDGTSSLTIDLSGLDEIAFFSVTTPGADSFGVDSVSIDTPIAAGFTAVPEPSTYAIFGAAVLGFAAWSRRRKTA